MRSMKQIQQTPAKQVMQTTTFKKYSGLLEDYCQNQRFGTPEYERSVVQFKDNLGRDVQFFNYKITIPALVNNYGSFQWTKLWPSDVDAREGAAQFVFLQLGIAF